MNLHSFSLPPCSHEAPEQWEIRRSNTAVPVATFSRNARAYFTWYPAPGHDVIFPERMFEIVGPTLGDFQTTWADNTGPYCTWRRGGVITTAALDASRTASADRIWVEERGDIEVPIPSPIFIPPVMYARDDRQIEVE